LNVYSAKSKGESAGLRNREGEPIRQDTFVYAVLNDELRADGIE